MAEDAEKRGVDRVVYGSSSPTPAASSAGASSPAIPANMTSVDWCGSGKGRKGGSLSRSGPHPPWPSATSTNTAGGSLPGSSQSLCRPWDRGDLLKRLSSFKSSSWLAAPKVSGPLACARRGWVSVEDDFIACEACGVQLRFPGTASLNHSQGESPGEVHNEQLDTAHKASCPWKGNPCAESLAQFLPSPASALIGGFDDRCDALLQFSSLPVISGSAIDQMKLTRGPEIDRLLSKPPPSMGSRKIEDGSVLRQGSLDIANDPFYQAQRLISLCGWEPRFLPHVLDCEEHSAHSTRKDKTASPHEGISHRLPESSMFLPSRTTRLDKRGPGQNLMMASESNCDPLSAVLDCSLCGATVSLKSFTTAARPLTLMPSGLIEFPEPRLKYAGPVMRNTSAASGVDGLHTTEAALKERDPREEAGDAAAVGDEKMSSYSGAIDLNLTAASGATPAQQGTAYIPCTEPANDSLQLTGQPEGSEMGGPVASYESFGPGFKGQRMDEGGSTVDRPQSRMHRTDSIEGTVLDYEGDEADDGEVRRKRSYAGETSKRKRGGDSSAGDQLSYGLAITDPGCSNFLPAEIDYEADDTERLKRNRREEILQELNKQRILPVQPSRNSIYSSSVIAVDTSNSKQENSMESVENFPQDSDLQGTAFSWERSERVDNEELNDLEQAQQSTCHQGNAGLVNDGPSDPGISTSDEGGIDTAVENDAACFGASIGMGHGVSVGMSGGSVQMGASHEAEIHGTDLSVHKMESLANDAELITELTDLQRQTSESVPGQALTGQSLPEDMKLPSLHNNPVDSHETAPSFSAAKVYSGVKHEESGQEESSEGKHKRNQEPRGDKLVDATNTNNGVLQVSTNGKDPGFRGSVTDTANGAGKRRGNRRSREQGGEFDPIHAHYYFCPWINGYVAAAGAGDTGRKTALCGWQLTIDALDLMQNRASTAPMGSESAASMHKGNGLAVYGLHAPKPSSKETLG